MRKTKKKKTTNSNFQIGYHGDVTIKVVKDDKVIKTITNHNEGKINLFIYLANCLLGTYSTNDSPKYLRLFKDTTLNANNVLTDAIFVGSSTVEQVETQNGSKRAVAKLTFTLPGSILKEAETPRCLALYSINTIDQLANPLATNIIDSEHTLQVGQDTNLVIVWELSIGNM